MRITNQMMSNQMMLNINKNANKVNNLYVQLSTGKKIQMPSEDPITAGRALKFRNSVNEIEQYKKNADQANSWMDITNKAIEEVNSITTRIRELLVSYSDTKEPLDKKKIAEEIGTLSEELNLTMNQTYGGRYVFSGLRTDEQCIFTKDKPNLSYKNIIQNLKTSNIESTKTYYKPSKDSEPIVSEVDILKLPYANAKNITINNKTVTTRSIKNPNPNDDTYNPYDVGEGEIVYIEETGELIFGKGVKDSISEDGNIKITYDKDGFSKGEINPKTYFTCTDENGTVFNMENQDMYYELGVGNPMNINVLGKNIVTDSMYADLKNFVKAIGDIQFSSEQDLRIKFTNEGLEGEELENAIQEQMLKEQQIAQEVMSNKFENMIGIMDEHLKNISTENTDLGVRMNRVDLIQTRLEDNYISFSELMSKNEDVDVMKVIMELNSSEVIYQAAMQAGANIIQMSLINFI